jgi:hypothetical protein
VNAGTGDLTHVVHSLLYVSYQQIVQTFNDLVTKVRHEVNENRPNRCNLWVTLEGPCTAGQWSPTPRCSGGSVSRRRQTVAADNQRLSF